MSDLAEVEDYPSALACWQGRGHAMPVAHRHDDLEVNLVTGAPLSYLFGGTLVQIMPGQAAVFWASVPHRLIDCAENWSARVRWLHIPLSTVLGWGLAADTMAALLRGAPLIAEPVEHLNARTFERWSEDLDADAPDLTEITLLEIQAGVRRLLREAVPPGAQPELDTAVHYVATMARYVAQNFHEDITAADVAAAAHLHPNYAMTLFRQVLGVTLHSYLVTRRIAEAQRHLLTTDLPMSQVAQLTGFGSLSGFYATFTRICGQPPGEYRRTAWARPVNVKIRPVSPGGIFPDHG